MITRRATAPSTVRRTVRSLGYLVTGLPAGIVGFAGSLVGLLLVALTSVTQLAGPVLVGAVRLLRAGAGLERGRAGWVLPSAVASPYLPDVAGTLNQQARRLIVQPATWRDLAWAVALLPVGLGGFVAGVVVTAVEVGALTAPAWAWAVPNPNAPAIPAALMGSGPGRLILTGLGVVLLPVAGWLLRTLAEVQARLARALLAPGEYRRLVERADRLAETRARVVDAQAAELRRIERDLHDGAQARIVAAGMTLALAERKLRTGGEAAPDVRLARRQLDDALADLRHLVRGIHPPILTDRGLHQALEALLADSPLDVRLHGDPVDRYPPAVESAAYFVVAEGLTNAAKHADATSCDVTLSRSATTITVTISDNGRGGADLAGSGLDGLRRRVEALDGTLTLTSPPGGPTVLATEFPCAS